MLELELLGDVRVKLHGAVVTVAPGRQRQLLARLALADGRFVQVAQLIDDLWEDRPPDSAANALQVYVSALRKLLGPAAIRTRGRSYALDDTAVVDVTRFRTEITAGLAAASGADAAAAIGWLDRGLSRWISVPCQDLDEIGFVTTARTDLTDLYLSGMEARAAIRLSQGSARELIPELRDLAGQYPFREAVQSQLILALAADGRQVEALAAYDRVRTALVSELGIDPGRALQAAHAAVLRNELPVPRPRPDGRPPTSRGGNLPVALTSFVGRQPETAEIIRLLATVRMLTLTGPGGCGKTRLAITAAGATADRHPDGAWLIELGVRTDLTGLLQALALALGVKEAAHVVSIDPLLAHLRDRELLLILDNCEHLVLACAEFSAIALASCPGLRILATSRTRLGVPGEVEWPVPPLPVPDSQRLPPLDRLAEYASVRLFIDRAAAVLPGFELTQSNAAAVAAVCARLAGLPLAIELAAARARVLSVAQIAARLDEQLALLSDPARHRPPRQRTLRQTMDWSFDLLADREQALFARLSVFTSSFSLEAAETMAGDDADGLDVFSALVIHSLIAVERDEDSARYRLLEPLRHYATERLSERGEIAAARARHAIHYQRLAHEASGHLDGGPGQAAWFRLLELERDNLRAAVQELLGQADLHGVASMVASLWRFYLVQGAISEGRQLLEQALDDPSVTGLLRARALRACGVFAHELLDYSRAASCYAQSRELFTSAGESADAAGVLANLGLLAANQSQFDRAAAFMEESLRLRRAVGDVLEVALSLDNLGMLALDRGDLARAREYLQDGLEMFRLGNDMVGESVALNNLSRVAVRQGDTDAAVELYRLGLELNRELADQWSTGYCLQGLAELAASRSELTAAASLLGAAATLRDAAAKTLPSADEAEYRELRARVRTALGAGEFQRAWSDGVARGRADPIGFGLDYVSRLSLQEGQRATGGRRLAITQFPGPGARAKARVSSVRDRTPSLR